jgi:hypothetical protein
LRGRESEPSESGIGRFSEKPVDATSRQAHHVCEGAVDRLDETRPEPLHRVSPGLVERLSRRHVPEDLFVVERRDPHPALFDRLERRSGGFREVYGGHDPVIAAGESAQHLAGVSLVPRLAEDRALEEDERVGREHPRA